MELKFSTWQEVETYLHKSKAIVLPIGSTEQHGPNGLIGTDALCPESLAVALGEKTGALIAPTISVGMAQHHLGFPGSITLHLKEIHEGLPLHPESRARALANRAGESSTPYPPLDS